MIIKARTPAGRRAGPFGADAASFGFVVAGGGTPGPSLLYSGWTSSLTN